MVSILLQSVHCLWGVGVVAVGLAGVEGLSGVRGGGVAEQGGDSRVGGGRRSVGGEKRGLPGMGGEGVGIVGGGEAVREGGEKGGLAGVREEVEGGVSLREKRGRVRVRQVVPLTLRKVGGLPRMALPQ